MPTTTTITAPISNKIAIIASNEALVEKAAELAQQLNLPLIAQPIITIPFLLILTPNHLELQETGSKNSKPIIIDFLSPKLNYRVKHGGGKNQLIAKAIGIKNKKTLKVLDATAGFGVDAFILATLGCEVVMLERSPVIGALLEDGLTRLKKEQPYHNLKINLYITQATVYLKKIIQHNVPQPDVIYLDPMFPQRQKSALNKKTMRILHEIVGADDDAHKLLALALKSAKNRVVVKRPKNSPSLTLLKPDLQLASGGSSRYDIYLIKKAAS